METPASSGRRVRTGLFEIDFGSGEVHKEGRKVPMQEQPFRVLAILLERPGEVVTREQLQAQLWPADTYVGFEEGLNTAIRKLRVAFGDSAENPRFIETVSRRGYRFVAPIREAVAVTPQPSESVAAPDAAAEVQHGRPWHIQRPALVLSVAALLVILAGIAYLTRWHSSANPAVQKRVMLAILPFQNLSNDPEQEYFSDGLTEETITDLGKLTPEQLGVIARTSAMAYKHTNKTIRQIGHELGVDYILEGSVRRDGEKVRIAAQLIRVQDQTHLWAQSYDRELPDFLGVQNELAQVISQQVGLRLTPGQKSELETTRRLDPEAYDLYLKGLYHWNMLTPTGFRQAINYFQEAAKRDPKYALAYAGLADCYAVLPMISDSPPRESFPGAQAAAARALELDDALAQAHDSDARIKLFYEWNWAESERQSVRAIALNRNLAGAHVRYAHLLSNVGRHKEALAEAERARELDPLSLITNALFGMFLFQARQYDAAVEQLQKTITMNPHFWVGHLHLGKVYEQKGMYQAAIEEFTKARDLSEGNSETIASLGHAYALSGRQDEARNVLEELKRQSQKSYVPPYNIAMIYAGLGEKDQALDWLEKGYEARDVHMIFLKVDPKWDSFRSDSRFQDLLQRMGFTSGQQ
jgi:TolB-like protein/DNA-binding winged helix-turn-helix (wHTH) protein/Tfp pilus assembly protein PilF